MKFKVNLKGDSYQLVWSYKYSYIIYILEHIGHMKDVFTFWMARNLLKAK